MTEKTPVRSLNITHQDARLEDQTRRLQFESWHEARARERRIREQDDARDREVARLIAARKLSVDPGGRYSQQFARADADCHCGKPKGRSWASAPFGSPQPVDSGAEQAQRDAAARALAARVAVTRNQTTTEGPRR